MKRLIFVAGILGASALVAPPIAIAGHEAGAKYSLLALTRVGFMQATDGKGVYVKNCKQCHGVIGVPTKDARKKYEKIASFIDPDFFAKRTTDSMVVVLRKGAGKDMQSFSDKLSPEEMKAVAEFIRTLAKPKG